MSTVGENILYMRKSLGWTQEELAKRMGYKSKSTINKIEMGINDIPQSKIAQFAKVLGTTPAHLMGWVDESKDQPEGFSPEEPKLSEGEKILIDLFRKVPEEQQQMVLQMIRVALGNQE
jgi:transcriptional regulator with XRE-family HTH domain